MSNHKLSGKWHSIEDSSQEPHAIIAALPRGINSKVLIVGPPELAPPDFSHAAGIPFNFTSIGAAMASIPLAANPEKPADQWTILVTPGVYEEVIRFKPHVNVVGLLKEAVIIKGGPENHLGVRAQVYLCTRSLLSNVTLHISENSQPRDFVVRGYDVNGYTDHDVQRENVRFLGLCNVDFQNASAHLLSAGGLIKFEGNDWRTVIFRDVGGNYDAPEGFGIELFGRGQNADCHFINCFFDALHMGGRLGGGFIHIRDCVETHIRNSLIRVGYMSPDEISGLPVGTSPISAVKTTQTEYATNVLIEGSSLYGPDPSVLDLGDNTLCYFRHSSSDSRSGNGKFHISKPDGIGDLCVNP
jgi:hypothetical protein